MKTIFGVFLALVALTVFVSYEFRSDAKNANDFMMKAAESDMAEIQMGNLALQKAQSEEVKRFAQMMVDDHTKTSQELMSLAQAKNVTLPTELSSKHKSAMNKLTGLSGAEFDKAYMRQQVKDHEAAVKLFQKQAGRNDDAELQAFASKNLPALQSHLQMARSMASGNMNSNMNMNSGGNTNRNTNSNRNMNSNTSMNSNMRR